MKNNIPHIVQYQGSKRILANQILQYMPAKFDRLLEPFSGMASISIAVAYNQMANSFVINDINKPIIEIIKNAVENPEKLINDYTYIWKEQFSYGENHIQHYYNIRDRFNNGENSPENMLYLLARCVKGSVRYGKNGKFNQSPDKRRHGTNPKTLAENVRNISILLKGKTEFYNYDYRYILDMARPGDLVYMDPPYQGVSNVRDNRYLSGLTYDEFSKSLNILNQKGVDYLISYDGECGGKEYGKSLPKNLNCKKILLNAGRSTQATLLGTNKITRESLYISENLAHHFNEFINIKPQQLSLASLLA